MVGRPAIKPGVGTCMGDVAMSKAAFVMVVVVVDACLPPVLMVEFGGWSWCRSSTVGAGSARPMSMAEGVLPTITVCKKKARFDVQKATS